MSKSIESRAEQSSVQTYLREIGQYPLIDKAQEYQLWEDMVPGRELRESIESERNINFDDPAIIRDKLEDWYGDVLSAEELGIMHDRFDTYLEARDMFIKSNLRLVVAVAKRHNSGKIPFLDMISEGNIGLITAVDKFDASKGFKFSTYGTFWISQAMQRAGYSHDYSLPMRVPYKHHETLASYLRTVMDFPEVSGRDGFARVSEIEAMSGIDAKTQAGSLALHGVRTRSTQLDKVFSEGGKTDLYSLLGVEESGYQEVEQDLVVGYLLSLAESILSDREMRALTGRLGLESGEGLTFDELGISMGVTVNVARGLYYRAQAKLREAMLTHDSNGSNLANDSD